MDKKLESVGKWLRLRKKTVVAHWLYGVLCAYVAMLFFPAGLVLLGIFAGDEYWNDWCEKKREGEKDWWDAFLFFCIGFIAILILQACNIVSVRWY